MNLEEKLRDEKLEQMKHKYFGVYRGIVTNVNDPLKLGRIRAKVHELFGDKDETNWASYCAPFGGSGAGFCFLPSAKSQTSGNIKAGDGIWIMFEAGDINKPVWMGYWFNEVDSLPQDAKPEVNVIQTKSGHKIILDDRHSNEKITIEDKSGQVIELNCQEKQITITAKQKVVIKSSHVEIGEGSSLSGVITHNTHSICYMTGLPIGHSLTVQGQS